MRTVVVAVVAVAVTAGAGAAVSGRTDLRIRVWPDGTDGGSTVWTLRCAPAGGTLPQPVRACRLLASLRDPFAPVPKDAACSAVYGGPQVALVTGTFRGHRVWTWFQRRNGCEIGRWNRVRVLFPVRVSPADS